MNLDLNSRSPQSPTGNGYRQRVIKASAPMAFFMALVWLALFVFSLVELSDSFTKDSPGMLPVTVLIWALSGAMCIRIAMKLAPGSDWISLGPEGMILCQAFTERVYPWSGIESISVDWIGRSKYIVLDCTGTFLETSHMKKPFWSLSDHDASIPNGFAMGRTELLHLLNVYWEQRSPVGNTDDFLQH